MATYTHQFAEHLTRSGFLSGAAGIEYRTAEFNLAADQVANGNVFEFFRLPADALVVGVYLHSGALDTNGTPTLTINVGHDGNTGAFLVGSSVVQVGGSAAATGGVPLLPRDPTDPVQNINDPWTIEEGTVISARFATAAATAAAGRLALTVGYIRTR